MTRGGRTRAHDAGERRCVVTRESRPRAGLVRFVIGPGGAVVPDLAERLPGRGIWVTADGDLLATAVRKNAFARAAKGAARPEPGLVDAVEAGLARRIVEHLSLARRAGEAIAGREKVREALVKGGVRLLLQAADGSPRERAELRPPEGEDTHFGGLSASEMGLAFGRDRVIHAAMLGGGLTDRVIGEARRLAGFRKHAARSGTGQTTAGDVPREERLV